MPTPPSSAPTAARMRSAGAPSAAIRESSTSARAAASWVRDHMGQIYAQYELMPGDTEVDLDAIVAKLPSLCPAGVKYNEPDTKIEPVAFGLKKIVAAFIIDDSDDSVGGKLEEALRGVDGIENVECVNSTVL